MSQEYVDGSLTGDPSLTVFPPVAQYRDQYRILTPADSGLWGWQTNYVVLASQPDNKITLDGAEPAGCVVTPAGSVDGKDYESRRCPVGEGVHALKGTTPFGVIAYGYGPAWQSALPAGDYIVRVSKGDKTSETPLAVKAGERNELALASP